MVTTAVPDSKLLTVIKQKYVKNSNDYLRKTDYVLKLNATYNTAQKIMLSNMGFFSICDQIRRKLRIWSHLMKEDLVTFTEEILNG